MKSSEPDIKSPEQSESSQNEQTQDPIPPSLDDNTTKPPPICRFYQRNVFQGCRTGRHGKGCNYEHPVVCWRYLNQGPNNAKGCQLGKKCSKYHPLLCRTAVSTERNPATTNPDASFCQNDANTNGLATTARTTACTMELQPGTSSTLHDEVGSWGEQLTLFIGNIQGLLPRMFSQKVHMLSELSHQENALAICLTEPHLNDTIGDSEIQMKNLQPNRVDRIGRKKGGVITYVMDKFASLTEVLLGESNSFVEVLALHITPLNLVLVNLYRPPACENEYFRPIITKLDALLENLSSPMPELACYKAPIPRDRKAIMRKRSKLHSRIRHCNNDHDKRSMQDKVERLEEQLKKSHRCERTRDETHAVEAIQTNYKYFFKYVKKWGIVNAAVGPLVNTDGEVINNLHQISKTKVSEESVIDLQYADDAAYVGCTAERLQQTLNVVADTYRHAGLNINTTKTEVLSMTEPPHEPTSFHINDIALKNVTHFTTSAQF
ncbi:hypothetical protein Pmani_014415 [Petrolisthes manimaculis]|uniref:C3H1-type domain-containing protein n=1 Tax=Petrolisthes manimaculis TaxID=1843537 RepID=A0AAE1PUC8_9EUCA|nr:hypothetical protein Pmani_014415 [Petrolisthes manimaculis]